jgi:hypothetical protein
MSLLYNKSILIEIFLFHFLTHIVKRLFVSFLGFNDILFERFLFVLFLIFILVNSKIYRANMRKKIKQNNQT